VDYNSHSSGIGCSGRRNWDAISRRRRWCPAAFPIGTTNVLDLSSYMGE
jgi:hypothetical protein